METRKNEFGNLWGDDLFYDALVFDQNGSVLRAGSYGLPDSVVRCLVGRGALDAVGWTVFGRDGAVVWYGFFSNTVLLADLSCCVGGLLVETSISWHSFFGDSRCLL